MTETDLDRITLRGMRFHALVGILPHERAYPQPVEIDLTAWVRPGGEIIDYRRLYAQVSAEMESPKLMYLERIADAIAARALAEAGVEKARVVIRKPHAAVGGPLDCAEVTVVRSRNA